jgi:hypothetical protein|tara:strand:- start:468 stop:860 length:393 start_codon:yes stop_codon:yes gene_type:complete
MANLSIVKILESGVTSSLADCNTDGDEFANSGIEILRFENTHASAAYSITITAQATSIDHKTYGALTKANVVKAITAGQTVYFGPFKQRAFNDADQKVQLTYLTSGGAAISTISSGVHALKVEALYLEQI